MDLEFIHAVSCVNSLLLFIEKVLFHCMHTFGVESLFDRHLCWLICYLLSKSINIHWDVSLLMYHFFRIRGVLEKSSETMW